MLRTLTVLALCGAASAEWVAQFERPQLADAVTAHL